MSLSQMQEAMTELIRLPELNRGDDLSKFISRFELTPDEYCEIEAIAHDPKVVKYGRAMAFVRWETIVKQTPFSKKYWNEDAAEHVWRYLFEPTAPKVRFRELGAAYLRFVLSDEKAISIFRDSGPPFLLDVFQFESAQAEVRLENRMKEKQVPEDSCLKHMAFSVDRYQYKISSFVRELTKPGASENVKSIHPEPGAEILLVIPKGESSNCRFFEVDERIEAFLKKELQNPGSRTSQPDFYGDLVQLGLVKE